MGTPGIDFPGLGVGLVILRDRKILLYKRMRAPEAGHWSIVGGKVDHMEPAEQAARREAEEETGLSIGRVNLLGPAELISKADEQHWISLLYMRPSLTVNRSSPSRTNSRTSAGSAVPNSRGRFPPLRRQRWSG